MLKEYWKSFVEDESGMELLQLAIVVVITVGLIGVVTTLQKSIATKINDSNSQVTNWDPSSDPLGGAE